VEDVIAWLGDVAAGECERHQAAKAATRRRGSNDGLGSPDFPQHLRSPWRTRSSTALMRCTVATRLKQLVIDNNQMMLDDLGRSTGR
jgi:hypothetical protein